MTARMWIQYAIHRLTIAFYRTRWSCRSRIHSLARPHTAPTPHGTYCRAHAVGEDD